MKSERELKATQTGCVGKLCTQEDTMVKKMKKINRDWTCIKKGLW